MSLHGILLAAAGNASRASLAALVLAACAAPVQVGTTPAAAGTAITTANLRARVYAYADDSMMGREAPGPYNDKATDYIASEARRLGLEPAGENGSWFQHVLTIQALDSAASSITVGGRTFRAGPDFLPRWQGSGMRDIRGAQVVYGGTYGSAATMIDSARTGGRIVVFVVPPLASGQPGWQANRGAMTLRYRNAAAVVVATLDAMPADVQAQLIAPTPSLRGAEDEAREVPQFLYATAEMTRALLGAEPADVRMGTAGATVQGSIVFRQAPARARNVVAVLRGHSP